MCVSTGRPSPVWVPARLTRSCPSPPSDVSATAGALARGSDVGKIHATPQSKTPPTIPQDNGALPSANTADGTTNGLYGAGEDRDC